MATRDTTTSSRTCFPFPFPFPSMWLHPYRAMLGLIKHEAVLRQSCPPPSPKPCASLQLLSLRWINDRRNAISVRSRRSWHNLHSNLQCTIHGKHTPNVLHPLASDRWPGCLSVVRTWGRGSPDRRMVNGGDTRPLQTSCPGRFLLLALSDSFPIRPFSLQKMSKSRGRVHHATCLLYLNHCWSQLGVDVHFAKANKKRRGIDNTQGLWGLGDKGAVCRIGQGGCVGGGRGRGRGREYMEVQDRMPIGQATRLGLTVLFYRARSGCATHLRDCVDNFIV